MHPRLHRTAAALLAALLGMASAHAAVTPEEAAKLKTELTPFGAEKLSLIHISEPTRPY